MDDWLDRYAAALAQRLGRDEASLSIPREAVKTILDLARMVAHGTERVNAPLASYVAGRYAAARAVDGIEAAAAVAEAREVAEALLATGSSEDRVAD